MDEQMIEAAYREGFQHARECLSDDEAFTLTVDVEEDCWRDSRARAAHGVIAVKIAELADENTKLRMQLVATLAGTYNVAPHATTNMCGRLDDSGLLLASVKEMAASLHSIKPDAARAALAPHPERRSE